MRLEHWRRLLRKKPFNRRIVRYGLLAVNIIIVLAVVSFVTMNRHSQAANPLTIISSLSNQNNPLDQLSSADIAESVANVVGLPEATAVRNEADSVNAELAVTPAEDVIAAKPQVLATALKDGQDVQIYKVRHNESVTDVANEFNVTSSSIEWSNNLASTELTPGMHLLIPPVNGIVYVVRPGDTAQSLASKYASNAQQIITFNNDELSGLRPGQRIVIPNGQVQPEIDQNAYSTSAFSVSAINFTPTYGDNGYDYGFCTWYVASQINVPSNWGNADTWAYYAAQSGWNVSSVPTVGSIAQTSAGYAGHVAIVDGVSGALIKYKDMNGIAGWGAVGQSGWVPASVFENYITH